MNLDAAQPAGLQNPTADKPGLPRQLRVAAQGSAAVTVRLSSHPRVLLSLERLVG